MSKGLYKKQFGVWMDGSHATIVGRENLTEGDFKLLAHVKGEGNTGNSSEHAANNAAKQHQHKFFKDILQHMQNAEEIFITGPGKSQEQFKHFLADTPQFKNTHTILDASQKVSDNQLIEMAASQFN